VRGAISKESTNTARSAGRMKDMAYLTGATDGDLYMAAYRPGSRPEPTKSTLTETRSRQRHPPMADAGRHDVRGPAGRAPSDFHKWTATPPIRRTGVGARRRRRALKDFTPGQGIADRRGQARN